MKSALRILAVLGLLLVATPLGAQAPAEFKPLPLDKPVTAMAITEDTNSLLLAHQDDDLISVWDIREGKILKTFSCTKPKFILCRGDRAYVINDGKGTISVFDATQDWALVKEVPSGQERASHLSAPAGKYFQEKVLATGPQAGRTITMTTLVDVANAQLLTLPPSMRILSVMNVSYDGAWVIGQDEMARNFFGVPGVFAVDNPSDVRIRLGEGGERPFLYQLHEGSIWVSCKGPYMMPGCRPFAADLKSVFFFDVTRPVFYTVKDKTITACRLNSLPDLLGSVDVTLSEKWIQNRPARGELPLAVTHQGKTRFFRWISQLKQVYSCEIDAPVLTAAEPKAVPPTTFTPLVLARPASGLAITENGDTLLISHQEDNLISVWDVKQEKLLKTLRCPKPGFILCRGDRAYVINDGRGTITVLDGTKDWAIVNEILSGIMWADYLSAPGGKYFRGKLLVTGSPDRGRLSSIVDVQHDRAQVIPDHFSQWLATFSYNGTRVILQAPYTGSPPGCVHDFDAAQFLSGKSRITTGGWHYPYMYQVNDNSFWFTCDSVHFAFPPTSLIRSETGKVRNTGMIRITVFPDVTRPACYVLDTDSVTTRSLVGGLDVAASTPVTIPQEYDRCPTNVHELCAQFAATHGPNTHLFRYVDLLGCVYQCRIDAAPLPEPGILRDFPLAEFRPLPLDKSVTAMTITENGDFLLLAHQDDDLISVWDIKQGKVIKTITCQRPRHILCRSDKAYVINDGKGTITILDASRDWAVVNELLAGVDSPYYLSAPGGKNFKGKLLVTGKKEGRHKAVLVDIATDRARDINVYSLDVATFSYDGSIIMRQENFDGSPTGMMTTYKVSDFLAGQIRAALSMESSGVNPYFVQVGPGLLWFGSNAILRGDPPKRTEFKVAGRIFPDVTRSVFYVFDNAELTTRRQNEAFDVVTTTKVTFPHGFDRQNPYPRDLLLPIAATHGEIAYLFQYVQDSGRVYHCRIPAINTTTVASTTPQGTPLPEPPKPTVAQLPEKTIVGKMVTCPLFEGDVKATYTIMSGPTGVAISEKGILTWTPAQEHIGPQQIKIKVEIGEHVSFLRLSTEVVSAEVAALVGGELPRLAELGIHTLDSGKYHLTSSLDGQSMILLRDRKLDLLDPDGLVSRKTLELKAAYTKIEERADCYVALGPDCLDVLDKNTLEITKHVELPGRGTLDMALHPSRRETYVSIFDDDGGKLNPIEARQIFLVSETTGARKALPRTLGHWLVISPDGKSLYAALHEMYRAGTRIDWHIGEILPDYGHIDVLVSYDISTDAAPVREANLHPGVNGAGLRIAPDGQHVSYIAAGGYRAGREGLNGYTIPAFNASDIRNARISYNTDAYPRDIGYHPSLDLVIACNEKEARLFERKTGTRITDKLDTQGEKLSAFSRVYFSASGRYALLDCKDGSGKRVLRAFPLNLTDEETKRVEAANKLTGIPPKPLTDSPEPKTRTTDKIKLTDFGAIQGSMRARMDAKGIARLYNKAVVVVTSESGTGTGFIVGNKGYILTCEHVLPVLGNPDVVCRQNTDGKITTKTYKAIVVQSDKKRDLALLKIEPDALLPIVHIETAAKIEMGEQVFVIGNPGIGDVILDYTMTEGIISSPHREIAGVDYIQTSAAINPGSSGSPVFNSMGNVVGLAVLKARMENTGFAVPASALVDFLKSCVTDSTPPK